MMSKLRAAAYVVVLTAAMFGGQAASATVLWDNGLGADNANSGWFSSQLRNWRVFDDFTLTEDARIDDVFFQMGLTQGGSFNGSFTFSIYNYLGGNNICSLVSSITLNPGNYTAVGNSINSFPFGPFFDIDFSTGGLALSAGDYAVSFYGLGAMDFRTPNVGSGNSFYQQSGVGTVFTRAGDTPFRLNGVVPNRPQSYSWALA